MMLMGQAQKKDDKTRKDAYKKVAGGGGKGKSANREHPKDINFGDGGPTKAQTARMDASNAADSGYGYHDRATGKYVPWYIDMFNGGGANAAGDTFQGGGILSDMANSANIAPYGYNRPRAYSQPGMLNTPTYQAAATTTQTNTATPKTTNVAENIPELSIVPFNNQTPVTQYSTAGIMNMPDEMTMPMFNNRPRGMSNEELAALIENTPFSPPGRTMEQVRLSMAKQMLADKYGSAFFTMPEPTKQTMIQEALRQIGTGF